MSRNKALKTAGIILDYLRKDGPASTTEISEATGVNINTVGKHLREDGHFYIAKHISGVRQWAAKPEAVVEIDRSPYATKNNGKRSLFLAARIARWLRANGPVSAMKIADTLELNLLTVYRHLSREDWFMVAGTVKDGTAATRLWAVRDDAPIGEVKIPRRRTRTKNAQPRMGSLVRWTYKVRGSEIQLSGEVVDAEDGKLYILCAGTEHEVEASKVEILKI